MPKKALTVGRTRITKYRVRADESVDENLTVPSGGRENFSYRLIIPPRRGMAAHPQVAGLIDQFQETEG